MTKNTIGKLGSFNLMFNYFISAEVELIDDESSGTDDLDIEPAFDEIEQPNLGMVF